MGWQSRTPYGFSTLKILATVKRFSTSTNSSPSFSTLKILATVKPTTPSFCLLSRFSTLKILATVKHGVFPFLRPTVLVPLRF